MDELFRRLAAFLVDEADFEGSTVTPSETVSLAKMHANGVFVPLLFAEWLGRSPEARKWLSEEIGNIKTRLDAAVKAPKARQRTGNLETFRVSINGDTFVQCKLVNAVGNLLQVQMAGNERIGHMTMVQLYAVHPEEREAVQAMAECFPEWGAEMMWADDQWLGPKPEPVKEEPKPEPPINNAVKVR